MISVDVSVTMYEISGRELFNVERIWKQSHRGGSRRNGQAGEKMVSGKEIGRHAWRGREVASGAAEENYHSNRWSLSIIRLRYLNMYKYFSKVALRQ